jgi:hypothetical protein
MDEMIRTLASYFREMQDKGALRRFEEFKMRKKYRGDDTKRTIRDYVDIFPAGTLKRASYSKKIMEEI